jgi:hypothetical protein
MIKSGGHDPNQFTIKQWYTLKLIEAEKVKRQRTMISVLDAKRTEKIKRKETDIVLA